jgi:hypothetical protein
MNVEVRQQIISTYLKLLHCARKLVDSLDIEGISALNERSRLKD